LSCNNASVIDVHEVAQRIVDQMTQSVMDPRKTIRFELHGTSIYLSSQQATACALVVNELLQNAVEHGYRDRDSGLVSVQLTDDGEWVTIVVGDDGAGLPEDFDLKEDGGLGLRIVRSLVQGDLKGRFEIRGEQGVKAIVAFPKTPLGGSKS
jgi:two-component sensor histidine kinase